MTQLTAVEVKQHGQAVVVCLRFKSTECGMEQEDLLRQDLRRLLESIPTSNMIVDFAGVVSCSSGALGALIETQKQLTLRSGRLSLCRLDDHLRQKLQTLNLEDTVFPIYESESDALAALRR